MPLFMASGKMKYVNELVTEGYITLNSQDIPSELKEMNQGKFLKLKVTEKGNLLLSSLNVSNKKQLMESVENIACH